MACKWPSILLRLDILFHFVSSKYYWKDIFSSEQIFNSFNSSLLDDGKTIESKTGAKWFIWVQKCCLLFQTCSTGTFYLRPSFQEGNSTQSWVLTPSSVCHNGCHKSASLPIDWDWTSLWKSFQTGLILSHLLQQGCSASRATALLGQC